MYESVWFSLEIFFKMLCKVFFVDSARLVVWGVVRGISFVDHSVMVGESVNYDIQEMASLVKDKFDEAAEFAPDVCIQNFCGGCRHVISQGLCFDPFGAVIHCDKNVLFPRVCRNRGEWTNEVKAPFLEWL